MYILGLLLLFVYGLTAEDILPDGRIFNLPEHYPYILNGESPSSFERLYVLYNEQSNVDLSCPKGYSILEMIQELVVNQSFSHFIPNDIEKHHTASLLDYNEPGHLKNPPCPTLYDCLGYQACLFQFSNNFCYEKYTPSIEKALLLIIVCYRDDFRIVAPKFEKQKNLVLHMYKNNKIPYGMTQLEHIELTEDAVFSASCTAPEIAQQVEGYNGKCSESPLSAVVTTQNLWPLLGRTLSDDCRSTLRQVYCAFQYNKKGFCLPPVYHNRNTKVDRIYNFHVLPEPGYRPRIYPYIEFLSKHDQSLIPARLVFLIMVQSKPQTVMDLIQSIYREPFLFVIHVDQEAKKVRKELAQLILHSNFPIHNIYILPFERSFPTFHYSYESVRAQLEGFEELLRLGPWDFAINLSEDDIPLRNVDDLAMALAPYRGLSFLSSLHLPVDGKEKASPNEVAFSACDGFVFNVTSKSRISISEEFQIFNAPRGGAFSREFIEYLVDEKRHSSAINKFQFYLQTDKIPEESYIPTILMNSPYKNSLHLASIQTSTQLISKELFPNSDGNTQDLGVRSNGNQELLSMSHSSFYAQKFPSHTLPDAQMFAFELAKGSYYQFLREYLPPVILKELVEKAISSDSSRTKLLKDSLVMESILNLHVVPSFIPHDTCCRSKLVTSYTQFSDFNFWLDVSLFNKANGSYKKARLMLQPTIGTRICFNDGDLKMLFIAPWANYDDHSAPPEWPRLNFEGILPLPYGPAFSDSITVHLLLSKSKENVKCTNAHTGRFKGNSLSFNDKTSIKVNLRLISPIGKVKCATNMTLFWKIESSENTDKHKVKLDKKEQDAIMKNITIQCKKMEPGPWTFQLQEIESPNSRLYEFPLFLLDYQNADSLNTEQSYVGHLWELKHFAFVNQNYSFDFLKYEKEEKDFQHLNKTFRLQKYDLPVTSNAPNVKISPQNHWMIEWFACSGGFASLVIICLTIALFCIWRFRFFQNIVVFFSLSLVLVVILQVMLFMTLCKQLN